MIGRRLSHDTVMESIGSGGMGLVYRARDEALSLSRLNHPNIDAVYAFAPSSRPPQDLKGATTR